MKSYQIWLFLGLMLIFQNCTKNNECTPDTEQFIFQENKEIGITVLYEDLSIVYRYDIEEGENLVMEYIFDQEQ